MPEPLSIAVANDPATKAVDAFSGEAGKGAFGFVGSWLT